MEKVVARTGTDIPPDRMFLMKASLKTNGLNAYVSGMGPTKRIVVWDTTAGRIPDEEVMLVFGHESGHYVLHHIVKGLAISAVSLFFVFWACARVAEWMALRFGTRWGIEPGENIAPLATRTGFLILVLVVSVVSFLGEPVSNTVSRYFEHQADVYGQEAIHGLVADPQKTAVAGFNHLGEAWLEDPEPNRSSSSGSTAIPRFRIAPISPRTTTHGPMEGTGSSLITSGQWSVDSGERIPLSEFGVGRLFLFTDH